MEGRCRRPVAEDSTNQKPGGELAVIRVGSSANTERRRGGDLPPPLRDIVNWVARAWGVLLVPFRWLWPYLAGAFSRVLISMVLAVAVGYLLEQALVEGIASLWTMPNVPLTVAGAVAAILLICLWFRDLRSAAVAGVFFHVAIEDRSERPLTEDALLRTWATESWEYAKVMPFVWERLNGSAPTLPGGAPSEDAKGAEKPVVDWDAVANTSRRLTTQIHHSRVLAPGAEAVSVLVNGRPELVGPLGWAIGQTWSDDRALRMVVDNTSEEREPFFTFAAYQPSERKVAEGQTAASSGGQDSGYAALLLLREGPVAPESLTGARAEFQVVHDRSLVEQPSAYEHVLRRTEESLTSVPGSRLMLQGQSPASLVFAAGFAAARHGLEVGSAKWLEEDEKYSRPDWPPRALASDGTARTSDAASSRVSPLSRGFWTWLVVLRAFGLGFVLPLFAGAVALVLEWSLAGSQSGTANGGDWVWLVGTAVVTGATLAWGGWWLRKRLFTPKVTISVVPPEADWTGGRAESGRISVEARQKFHHRRIEVVLEPHDMPEGDDIEENRRTQARISERITATFTDVLEVLPHVDDVTVEIPDLGQFWLAKDREKNPQRRALADEVVHNFNSGLRSSLRGNKPVKLQWQTAAKEGFLTCSTGPGECACKENL